LSEKNVVTAGIIILQINHLSINMFDEFAEEKVNKLMVFLSEHGSRGVVVEV